MGRSLSALGSESEKFITVKSNKCLNTNFKNILKDTRERERGDVSSTMSGLDLNPSVAIGWSFVEGVACLLASSLSLCD